MRLKQICENFVGDLLGCGRCPATGDTFWNAQLAAVSVAENRGMLILRSALYRVPLEEIAKKVYETSKSTTTLRERFSLDKITSYVHIISQYSDKQYNKKAELEGQLQELQDRLKSLSEETLNIQSYRWDRINEKPPLNYLKRIENSFYGYTDIKDLDSKKILVKKYSKSHRFGRILHHKINLRKN